MLEMTVIIHTRNAETTLSRLMESVRWAEECIVVDMDSHDRTREIARQYGATVLQAPIVQRIDGIRNDFLECGRHEWILVLDADEYLAADAEQIIHELLEQYGRTSDAFFIPRYNMIAGQIMRGSNWYPDQQIRLFRKGCVRWSDTTHKLPEVVTGQERLHTLEPPGCLHIHHENYTSVEQFIERQLQYALKDTYAANGFSFDDYVAKAYEEFNFRFDEKNDGEISFALATIMAWDKVIRGLIHWERLGRKGSLSRAYSLPVTTVGGYPDHLFPEDVEELRNRIRKLESVPGAARIVSLLTSFGQRFPRAKNQLQRIRRYFQNTV